jgi:hypothetical protein
LDADLKRAREMRATVKELFSMEQLFLLLPSVDWMLPSSWDRFQSCLLVCPVFVMSFAEQKTIGQIAHRNHLPADPSSVWYNQSSNRSAYTNESLRELSSLLPVSERGIDLLIKVNDFMNQHIFPAEGFFFFFFFLI